MDLISQLITQAWMGPGVTGWLGELSTRPHKEFLMGATGL